jgi:hypothetical protein
LAATFKAVAGLSWCQWTPASDSVSSLLESVRGVVFIVIGSLRHDPLSELEVVDTWLGSNFEGMAFFFIDDDGALALFYSLLYTVNDWLRVGIDSEKHLSAVPVLDLVTGLLPDVIGR